tara:strand:+ start:424 stop:597 length:174 start_codon:yes stop_codon:yes gene_type:complete
VEYCNDGVRRSEDHGVESLGNAIKEDVTCILPSLVGIPSLVREEVVIHGCVVLTFIV